MAEGPKKPRSSDLPPARPVRPAAAKPVPAAPVKPVPVAPKAVAPKPVDRPAPRPAGPDPLIGRTIARCKIESKIGEGKTSRVYRATHTALDTAVAVKVLQPEVLRHPEIVVKFEQEARALAKFDHPNVVKIYDVAAEEGDVHAIVMELLEGETVLEMLDREGRVDPLDAMRIVRQAASGLAAAHAKSLVHRDVKPQNLVLLPDGTVKLVDFGLAAETGGELAAERIGTPHYMSPEVCDARPAEPGSDVYSLGVTLFHLLVGQPPYAGLSIKEILQAHVAGKPLHPERRLPGLPKGVCDLVRTMTKRDPLTRPDAAQVVAALDQVGGKALSLMPSVRGRRKHRGGGAKKPSGAPLLIAGGLAFVVILVAVLVLLNQGKKDDGGESKTTGGVPQVPATTPAPPTPPPVPTPEPGPGPAPPVPLPLPPVKPEPEAPLSPEAEARKKELEAAEKKLAEDRRKEAAAAALVDATEFARNNSNDKSLVVRRYREVANAWKGTDAAKEAQKRADGVEKGEIHPHPDRSFADKTELDKAREALAAAVPKIEEAISARKYEDALALVPEQVDDPSGKLTDDLRFWRGLCKNLVAFTRGLKKEVPGLPSKDRVVRTAKGELPVRAATDSGLQVERDADLVDLRYEEIEPQALADLATKAFAEKDYAEALAAFAFAHRLENLFYQALLGLSGLAEERASGMAARADARFAK